MKQAIIVFTNLPTENRSYATRLMPYLTGDECAGLQMAFLEDLSETLADALADLFVVYNGTDPELKEEFRTLFPSATFLTPVGDTDGDRMYHAMLNVFDYGCDRCLMIGSDAPNAKKADFNRAFDLLKRNDYVFGPTEEGGLWLIGAKNSQDNRLLQPIFSLAENRHERILNDVLEVISKWKEHTLLEEKVHINTIEDLLVYREEATGHSAEYLKHHHVISIIVPVFNQVAKINPFLSELDKLNGRCEVVFVDGGSTDGTWSVLQEVARNRYGYRVVRSTKGRGAQLNAGVEAANGDVFFFPTIDAILPIHAVDEMLQVLAGSDAGFFGVQFSKRTLMLRLHERQLNRNAKQGIVLGDQGLFLTRERFYEAGMFDEINGLEDVQLSQELHQRNVVIGMTPSRLIVDAPHYRGGFFQKFSQMRQVERLQKKLLEGVDAKQLLLSEPARNK